MNHAGRGGRACVRLGWPRTWPRLRRGQVGVLAGVLLVGFADRVTVVIGDQWLVLDLVANLQTARWWQVKVLVLVIAVAGWIWWGRRRAMRAPRDVGQLAARWRVPAPRPRGGGDR